VSTEELARASCAVYADGRPPRRLVWAVAALNWPGFDHPLVVTGSADGTGRVCDPSDTAQELAHLPLFGPGLSVVSLGRRTLAFGVSRGFLVFDLSTGKNILG
jgi:hypothetical protein